MPATSAIIGSLKTAVDRHRAKRSVPSGMSSSEWLAMKRDFRERAFFSSRVEDARLLDELRKRIDAALDPQPGDPVMTKQRFVTEMRRLLGAEGEGDANSLTDIASRRRLELIYEMNVAEAQAYARWRNWNDPDRLLTYPAQELTRVRASAVPRDWIERWQEEGGEIIDGRMLAKKTAPIWRHISRFDRPWPPFDFGSGMGLREISRAEAERLGVIRKGERLAPESDPGFNAHLAADVSHLSQETRDALERTFGKGYRIVDGEIRRESEAA